MNCSGDVGVERARSTACRSQTFVDQFTFTRFEPQGLVEGHPEREIRDLDRRLSSSVLARVEYLPSHRTGGIKPEIDSTPARRGARTSTPPEPPSLRQIPDHTAHSTRDTKPLPHTREATARSAAMSETLNEAQKSAPSAHGLAPHEASANASPLDAQLDTMMGDAPVCDVCGHITVRNGACYRRLELQATRWAAS